MPIPESQLEIWSHQGSVTQSSETYQTIRAALLKSGTGYSDKQPEVFLQGSYGNDTNIYAESDVDCVILYNGSFFHDLTKLTVAEEESFNSTFIDGTYPYDTFKKQVRDALVASFGGSVDTSSRKAIKITAGAGRRNVDVVVAFQYRHYYKFNSINDQSYDTGIVFFTSDGKRIVNYPKMHSDNMTIKHQATEGNFKPVVRIFKNMRTRLIDNNQIKIGIAPSYFIEGLLYNAPDIFFKGNYEDMVMKILSWLHQTSDRTEFVCANRQHSLFDDHNIVCWPMEDGDAYITEIINLWNNW